MNAALDCAIAASAGRQADWLRRNATAQASEVVLMMHNFGVALGAIAVLRISDCLWETKRLPIWFYVAEFIAATLIAATNA